MFVVSSVVFTTSVEEDNSGVSVAIDAVPTAWDFITELMGVVPLAY